MECYTPHGLTWFILQQPWIFKVIFLRENKNLNGKKILMSILPTASNHWHVLVHFCVSFYFSLTLMFAPHEFDFFSFFSFTLQEFYKRDLQPSFPHHLTISKSSSQTVIYHSVHYLLSFFNNLFISTCVYFLQ